MRAEIENDQRTKKNEAATWKKKRIGVPRRTKNEQKAILEKRRKMRCQRWRHEHETHKPVSRTGEPPNEERKTKKGAEA